MSPGDVESRRQNRTLRQKNLCDMSRTGCEGAMKTPENGRTNPSGDKWARYVTHYSSSGWARIDRGSGLDKMFIENATKNFGFVSCSWSVVSCGTGGGDLRGRARRRPSGCPRPAPTRESPQWFGRGTSNLARQMRAVRGIGLAPEVCGLASRLNHALSRAWSQAFRETVIPAKDPQAAPWADLLRPFGLGTRCAASGASGIAQRCVTDTCRRWPADGTRRVPATWGHWPADGTRRVPATWGHWPADGTRRVPATWGHWPADGTRRVPATWGHWPADGTRRVPATRDFGCGSRRSAGRRHNRHIWPDR